MWRSAAVRPVCIGRHAGIVRRVPDGAVLTLETLNRHVYPMNAMAIALGLHVRVGIEDTLFGPRHDLGAAGPE